MDKADRNGLQTDSHRSLSTVRPASCADAALTVAGGDVQREVSYRLADLRPTIDRLCSHAIEEGHQKQFFARPYALHSPLQFSRRAFCASPSYDLGGAHVCGCKLSWGCRSTSCTYG